MNLIFGELGMAINYLVVGITYIGLVTWFMTAIL